METIPPPLKKELEKKDQSYSFLQVWKKSFESLYKEHDRYISVFIKNDDPRFFKQLFDTYVYPKIPHGIGDKYDYANAELFVLLPDFCGLQFLVGLQYDRMYSDREILSDPLLIEGFDADCEPETKKWEDFYEEIHEKCEVYKNRIPLPPQPSTQDY